MTLNGIVVAFYALLTLWTSTTSSTGVDMGDCACVCDNNDGSRYITPMSGGKFLQSIKGLRGDMGTDGGLGPEGSRGPPGSPGARGPPGTPVKTSGTRSAILSSCKALRDSGTTASGIYQIKPNGQNSKTNVYCDMAIDGGGWTLIASVHENNIYGKCTSGDKWSSQQGLGTNYTGPRNWESLQTFGQPEGATSADFKSPAYNKVLGSDVMVWHVPNNVGVENWNEQSFLQYYTTNNFLRSYGGTLQILFSKYFPMEKQQSKRDRESGLSPMLTAVNNSAANISSNVENFYRYIYDQGGISQNQINDGGHDMFDSGNKVFYKIGSGIYKQIVYGKLYTDLESGTQILSMKSNPFLMLMWISNSGGSVDRFDIKVQSGTGADSQGSHRSYSGTVRQGNLTCEYESYNVYSANDPSICEIYFYCKDEQNWNSRGPARLTRDAWSTSTDNLVNVVYAAGSPQNILMGYTLLSKQPDRLVTEAEVQSTLSIMMSAFRENGPVPDINCDRGDESLLVPVQYAKGSNSAMMAKVPPAQRPRVDAGYVHFRAIDPTGNPSAICPGVRSRACFPQSVCVGGITPTPNSPPNIKRTCGDFAGWDGSPQDRPTQTEPAGSARSLDDLTSSILLFVR